MKKFGAAAFLAVALTAGPGQSARAASWFDVTIGSLSFGLEDRYFWACKDDGCGYQCKACKAFSGCLFHCGCGWFPLNPPSMVPAGFQEGAIGHAASAPEAQPKQTTGQQKQTSPQAAATHVPVGYYYPATGYGYYPAAGYSYQAPSYWYGR